MARMVILIGVVFGRHVWISLIFYIVSYNYKWCVKLW